VVGYVALFIALSGAAYATGLKKNSVKSKQIKNGQVRAQDIGDGAVGTADLADGAVTSGKIADGVIPSSGLADGSVTTPKLAGGAVTAAKLDDGSVGNAKLDDGSVDTAKLVDGSVGTADLADGSVTSGKIADGVIPSSGLADGSVTTPKLAGGSVTAAKLDDAAVGNSKLADGSVDTAKLADGSVSAAKVIDDTLGTADLAPNSVAASELADNAVDGAAIADGSVSADELAPDSVGASNVGANALGGADIDESGLAGVNAAQLGGIAAGGFALAGHNHDATYVNEGQANSIGAGMVTDTTRAIQLPLHTFIECTTDTGADINYVSGPDAFPDFVGRTGDGEGFTLSFDDTALTEDEDVRVCAQVMVPADATGAGGFHLVVRAAKDASGGNVESLVCGFAVNGAAISASGTATLGSAAQTAYDCVGVPVFTAQDVISVSFSIASPGTMDDQVDILGVELDYTASQ
jgi:hypothetical protein